MKERRGKRDDVPQMQMNGEIQDEFLKNHNVTKHSLPHKYTNAFLPFDKNVI